MMDHLKIVLAKTVQEFITEDMEVLLKLPANEAVKWEAHAISPLITQIKVWPDKGGPRYFNVILKENM
jgi:hypothetical protein